MYLMAAEHRMSATQVALTCNHAKKKNKKTFKLIYKYNLV